MRLKFSPKKYFSQLGLLLLIGLAPFSAIVQAQSVQYLLPETGGPQPNPLIYGSELEIDQFGNAYVSDLPSNAIYKITPEGTVSKVFDGESYVMGGHSEIGEPLALDEAGNLFATVTYEYQPGFFQSGVLRISPSGEQSFIIMRDGDGKNVLGGARVIVPDSGGNVYVGGYSLDGHNVFKIFPNGSVRLLMSWAGDQKGNILDIVNAIASDSSGNVFVAGCRSNNVFRINPDYSVELLLDKSGDGRGNELICPSDIHVGDDGSVYVTGYHSHNAFKVEPDGLVSELIDITTDGTGDGFIGGTGGSPHWAANSTTLLRPDSISTNSEGSVFIAGAFSGNIFEISQAGNIKLLLALDRQAFSVGEHFGSQPIATLRATKFDRQGNAYSLIPEYSEIFKLVIDESQPEVAMEIQGNISIPRVLVDDRHYRVMLTLAESGSNDYEVVAADELPSKSGPVTGSYDAGNIVIPELWRNEVASRVELTLVKLIPPTFRVVSE